MSTINTNNLLNKFPNLSYKQNQLMSDYTTMKVGGSVELMFFPKTLDDIQELLIYLQCNSIPYFILGKGSNLVVNDEGLELVVINTENLNEIYLDDHDATLLYAECGASLEELSRFSCNKELKGLEFASGIPGTVGGAVFMNAGAYGGEIKDVLNDSLIFTTKLEMLTNKEHGFSYRISSISKKNAVILRSSFRLEKGNKLEIENLIDDLTNQRNSKQPLEMPSAGSTFKRPEGYFAGKLITDAGLKGFQLKGAMVSTKHAGFVVNFAQAKAQDVLDLIAYIQQEVQKQFNVHLEPEVKFLEKNGTFKKLD